MPNRSSKPKRPRDLNQLAKLIVGVATGEIEDQDMELIGKKADSREGGLKGGKARAQKLTPQRRSEIAKKAAETRWKE